MKLFHNLFAAALTLVSAPAAAQEQLSVVELAERFEYAMVAGDYRSLPLTEDFSYFENGAQLDPWDGMWRTLTAVVDSNPQLYPELDYRVSAIGENRIMRVVEFDENSVHGVMAYRLDARDGKIARIDVLPIREEFGGDRGGTLTLLQPMLAATMDGELVEPIDPVFRQPHAVPRGHILRSLGAYFGVEGAGPSGLRFAEDCIRRDNGHRVTGAPDAPVLDLANPEFRPFALSCEEQFESGYYSNFTFGGMHFVGSDEFGLAIAFVRLDQPGTVLSFTTPDGTEIAYPGPRGAVANADTGEQFDGRILTNMITPMSVNGVYIFKFNEDGEVQRIDAFYRGAPLGWDAVPD